MHAMMQIPIAVKKIRNANPRTVSPADMLVLTARAFELALD